MELSQIHNTFRAWTQTLTDQGLPARFAHAPQEDNQTLVVSALLLTAKPDPKRRAHGPARRHTETRPLAKLRYLLSIGAPDADASLEQALVALLVQARDTTGMELLDEPLAPDWWLAYGLPPRPGFLLEASLTNIQQPQDAALVREHELEVVSMRTVHGRVLAADDTPIANAEIRLMSTGQTVQSDRDGAFRLRLAVIHSGAPNPWVRVQARGIQQQTRLPASGDDNEPWLIRIEALGS